MKSLLWMVPAIALSAAVAGTATAAGYPQAEPSGEAATSRALWERHAQYDAARGCWIVDTAPGAGWDSPPVAGADNPEADEPMPRYDSAIECVETPPAAAELPADQEPLPGG